MRVTRLFLIAALLVTFNSNATDFDYPATPADVSLVEGSLTTFENEYWSEIIGEIINNSAVPATNLSVSLIAFDSEGEVIAVLASRTSYTTSCTDDDEHTFVPCIMPNEIAYFSVPLPRNGPEFDHYSVLVQAWETTLAEQTVPVEIDGDLTPREFLYGWVYDGSLMNTGTEDIIALSTTAVFRDAAGQLLDVSSSGITGDRIGGYGGGIRAGQSIDFSISSSMGPDEYASYEVFITGREYRGGRFQYAVAGIAHKAGYDGARWRSSLTATNSSGADGHMRLRYFVQHSIVVEQELQIEDSETVHWDDVAPHLFGVVGESGGFVRIDSTVPLSITARTANENLDGSFGQLLPTLTPATTAATTRGGILTPVRSGDNFRTNIGFVNLSGRDCSVPVQLRDQQGTVVSRLGNVTVKANTWLQLNDVVPPSLEVGSAAIGAAYGCQLWPYASLIDHATHDPTTIVLDPKTTIYLNLATGGGGARSGGSAWSD